MTMASTILRTLFPWTAFVFPRESCRGVTACLITASARNSFMPRIPIAMGERDKRGEWLLFGISRRATNSFAC